MTEQQAPQTFFSIEKIYTKDISLEVPHAPAIFLEREQPAIDVQIHSEGSAVGEGVFETVLTVTVTAKLQDKTMFLVEVAQGAIFQIRGLAPEELDPVLGVTCPNILFPYAREVVSDIVVRAGFPPVLLNPINFDAIYQERQARQPAPTAAVN